MPQKIFFKKRNHCHQYILHAEPLIFFLWLCWPPGAFDLWAQTRDEHPASDELSQQQRQLPAPFFRGQTQARPLGRGAADAAGGGRPAAFREEEASDPPEAPEEEQRTLHHWHEWPGDQRIASSCSLTDHLCGCADHILGAKDTYAGGRTARPGSSSSLSLLSGQNSVLKREASQGGNCIAGECFL